MFADQLGFKRAVSIARRFDFSLPKFALEHLFRFAIANVASSSACGFVLAITEMVADFGIQGLLEKLLLQVAKGP